MAVFETKDLEIDLDSNLPVLTREDVNKLITETENVYLARKKSPEIYLYLGAQISVKGRRFLDPLSAEIISFRDSSLTKSEYTKPRNNPVQTTSVVKIPSSYDLLLETYSRMICANSINITPKTARVWLSLFFVYPQFPYYYKLYIRETDNIIQITEDQSRINDFVNKIVVGAHRQEDLLFEEVDMTAREEFVLKLKPMLTEHQIKVSVMMILGSDVVELCFPASFYTSAGSILNIFPKLVTVLYNFIRESDSYPEIAATYKLLNYSGLTMYKMVSEFMLAPKRTMAHRNFQSSEK